MHYDPARHHRRSIRLRGYDYSQSGAYFVTICTHERQRLFGEIQRVQMALNQIGKIAAQEWLSSATIRREIELDVWVIMPDHIHGIVIIAHNGGDAQTSPEEWKIQDKSSGGVAHRKPRSLSSFVAGFKAAVTKRIKPLCESPHPAVWQRNYYESIVRDERHLNNIRRYIVNNPQKWHDNPKNKDKVSQDIVIDFLF